MNIITLCALQSRHRDGYKLKSGPGIDAALAGAGLVESVIHDKVRVDDDEVTVTDRTPAGDPLVDEAVAELGRHDGGKAVEVLASMSRTFPGSVDRIMQEQGVVTSTWKRLMVVFPYRATRATDPQAWDRGHAELVSVLRGDVEATDRQVAVLHLLRSAGVSPGAFGKELGGSDVVIAATDRLHQQLRTRTPRVAAALELTDAASRRLLESGGSGSASF